MSNEGICFIRAIIPYEETMLNKLSETQKMAAVAFIYASEVMGGGHIGFWDLHGNYRQIDYLYPPASFGIF